MAKHKIQKDSPLAILKNMVKSQSSRNPTKRDRFYLQDPKTRTPEMKAWVKKRALQRVKSKDF